MANQEKQSVRENANQENNENNERQESSSSNNNAEKGNGGSQNFAEESSASGGVQSTEQEVESGRKPRRFGNNMAATGYAAHAFEEFDSSETRTQLAEHHVFHDPELARYGRF